MGSLKWGLGVSALVALMIAPAAAGQRGNSGNHGGPTHATPTHPNTPASGPKGNGGPHSDTSPKGNGGSAKKSGPTTTTAGTTASPTTINFATTPLGAKLTKNTALQSKLTTNLSALGYTGTVFEAAYGFKNLGQFVAATNVSRNLNIPFEQLKLQMTGLTVDASGKVLKANVNPDGSISMVDPANVTKAAPTKSLGQSIQTLKPAANATDAAREANEAAETEIEHTSTTVTPSATSPTTSNGTKAKKRS